MHSYSNHFKVNSQVKFLTYGTRYPNFTDILLLLLSRFSRVGLCATHRRQPTRLPCPWDSPGKNTGVDCHFLLQCMKVKSESEVGQSCPTLFDPMDYSLSGSSVHGIFQARVLEWIAISFSRGSSQPRNRTWVSCIQADALLSEPPGKPPIRDQKARKSSSPSLSLSLGEFGRTHWT